MERINRLEMYSEIVNVVSKRSLCPRKKVGGILIKEKRVIAMGYNGTLPNVSPLEGIDEEGKSKTIHAEANIISFCAKHGIPTDGCTLFITLSPCEKCAELITQAGITKVIYKEQYRDTTGLEILEKQGIVCHQYLKLSERDTN